MADYSYRERQTITHEWFIPERTLGVPVAEVYKALAAAERKFLEVHGRQPNHDDWCRFKGDGEEITIYFEEEPHG